MAAMFYLTDIQLSIYLYPNQVAQQLSTKVYSAG
jgi:hypothetical protein